MKSHLSMSIETISISVTYTGKKCRAQEDDDVENSVL